VRRESSDSRDGEPTSSSIGSLDLRLDAPGSLSAATRNESGTLWSPVCADAFTTPIAAGSAGADDAVAGAGAAILGDDSGFTDAERWLL
jgi:hypothetical protein